MRTAVEDSAEDDLRNANIVDWGADSSTVYDHFYETVMTSVLS